MPVTITIGEKVWNDEIEAWDIERTTSPTAPIFPNDAILEPFGNWRYVDYPVWKALAEECGIQEWLGRIIDSQNSDIIQALNEDDYRTVSEAYLLRTAFNEGKPGWDFQRDMLEPDQSVGELPSRFDEYLARLLWLRFWIRWSLDNCEAPSVLVAW
jgi:hypothetical protein